MAQYNAYTDIKIGTSVGGLVAVTALTYSGDPANCQPPKTSFSEGVEFPKTADGGLKVLGRPIIVWAFEGGVHYTARKALRAFITSGMSESLFIASPDQDGDIQNWSCVMNWPTDLPGYLSFEYIDSLEIVFDRCVQQ
jgi:hypothetical protein